MEIHIHSIYLVYYSIYYFLPFHTMLLFMVVWDSDPVAVCGRSRYIPKQLTDITLGMAYQAYCPGCWLSNRNAGLCYSLSSIEVSMSYNICRFIAFLLESPHPVQVLIGHDISKHFGMFLLLPQDATGPESHTTINSSMVWNGRK